MFWIFVRIASLKQFKQIGEVCFFKVLNIIFLHNVLLIVTGLQFFECVLLFWRVVPVRIILLRVKLWPLKSRAPLYAIQPRSGA